MKYKIVYSMAVIPERIENVPIIISNILPQCDFLYVNLVGFTAVPVFLVHEKIIVNNFERGGSEVRFFNYVEQEPNTYFFTVDDDILYPKNYTEKMVSAMAAYDNLAVICVHGSIVDLTRSENYYSEGRKVYSFNSYLPRERIVMLPGVGTSCFFRSNVLIDYSDFVHENMSDVFVGIFLAKQGVNIFATKRDSDWLVQLPTHGRSIWGNNPKIYIDMIINENKGFLNRTPTVPHA